MAIFPGEPGLAGSALILLLHLLLFIIYFTLCHQDQVIQVNHKTRSHRSFAQYSGN